MNQTYAGKYPGRTDVEKANYAANVAAIIYANAGAPAQYGLLTAQASAFAAASTTFTNALAPCTGPTRSPALVEVKDQAKRALKLLLRPLVAAIKGSCALSVGVTPTLAQLQALGLPCPSGLSPSIAQNLLKRRKISAPNAGPVLSVNHWKNQVCWLNILRQPNNTSMANDKAKPKGVIGAKIMVRYSDNEPWQAYDAIATKTPWPMKFNASAIGRPVQIKAVDVTRRGEQSPDSNVVHSVVTASY